MSKSLNDTDFTKWVQLTVKQLREKDFENLDLENLIDEVESLIYEQKKWITDSLITVLTYSMKRMFLDLPERFHDWERYVFRAQLDIKRDVANNETILEYWDDMFDHAWDISLIRLEADFKTHEEFERSLYPKNWQLAKDYGTLVKQDFWE